MAGEDTRYRPRYVQPAKNKPVDRINETPVSTVIDSIMADTHIGQMFQRHEVDTLTSWRGRRPVPGYNAFRDPSINIDEMNPMVFDELINADSREDVLAINMMSQINAERNKRLENHGVIRFFSGLADPYNAVPIPLVRGMGFVKAFKNTLIPNAAIVATAESSRAALDPNSEILPTAVSIGLGTLFASSIAGAFGAIPTKTPRIVDHQVNTYANISDYKNTGPKTGPSMKDMDMTGARFSEVKKYVPEGTTPEMIIRGQADDGLGRVIRLQALREEGQEFGDRFVIAKDDVANDFVLTKNGEVILRGKKKELIKATEDLGIQRVKNFASYEALNHGLSRKADVYPNAPDPKIDPEGYKKYVDDQIPFETAPRDENGVVIPEHIAANNRSSLRQLADLERLHIKEVKDAADAEVARIETELAIAQRQYDHPNQHVSRETSGPKVKKLAEELKKAKSKAKVNKEAIDNINERISLMEESDNPMDYMLRPTGIGIEKFMARSGQFPYFALVETKLVTLAPDLAVEWQRIAPRLAGSPGLSYKGGEKGVGFGTSAEMQAVQWWSVFRRAKMAADSEYAKLYGYGEKIGPYYQIVAETKESISTKVWKKDKDADVSGNSLSFHEFRNQISEALIFNGKASPRQLKNFNPETIKAIEAAAVPWRKFFTEFGEEGTALGVFQTQDTMKFRIEKVKDKIEWHQNEYERLTSSKIVDPFPSAKANIIEGPYPKGLKDPSPDGVVPFAFKRTDADGKHTIYIEPQQLARAFESQSWKNPRKLADGKSVDPINYDFKNIEEFKTFVIAHERSHILFKRKKGEGLTEYENRTNANALKEIGLVGDNPSIKKVAASNLDRSMSNYHKRKMDYAELQLDQLETDIENMATGDWLAADYFTRLWHIDKVKKGEAQLKEILTAHFTKNPKLWKRGKLIKASEDRNAITVRVNEAYDNIVRRGELDDANIKDDPAERIAVFRQRLADLKEIRDSGIYDPESVEGRTVTRRIKLYEDAIASDWHLGPMMSRPIRTRVLDIPNKDVIDFIEMDIEQVAQHYLHKMAPVIEITRNFGDRRVSDYRDSLNTDLVKRIAESRASGNHGLAEELEKEMEVLNDAVDNLVDMVTGVYGMSKDPSQITGRVIRTSMAWMNLVSMGKATAIALNDMGNYVGYVGIKNALGNTWRYTMSRVARDAKNEWNIGHEQVLMAGEASQSMSSQRMRAITDVGAASIGTKFERGTAVAEQRMFIFNLLTGWTDYMEGLVGTTAQSVIMREAIAMADGKLSPSRMTELTKLGMTKDMALRMSNEWHKIPESERMGRHLYLAGTHLWDDLGAARAFRAMLSTEIANLVPSPRAADKPLFMSKDWARVMFQYKGFSFAANTKIMMANLQRRDARMLSTFFSMFFMSMLIDMKKRPDYIELDPEDMIFRALEISGITGIFSDVNQAIEGISGGEIGMRPMLGLESFERDANMQTRFGAAAGAVPNLVTSFLGAFIDDDADVSDKARAIRYMIPYNNLIYYSWLVDRLQRGTVGLLE